MEVIDTQKARGILEDLRLQLKQTHEQFVLLTGAVQGAEAILAVSAEEEAAVEPNPPMTLVKKTRGKK